MLEGLQSANTIDAACNMECARTKQKVPGYGYFRRGSQGSFEELMSPQIFELGASGR